MENEAFRTFHLANLGLHMWKEHTPREAAEYIRKKAVKLDSAIERARKIDLLNAYLGLYEDWSEDQEDVEEEEDTFREIRCIKVTALRLERIMEKKEEEEESLSSTARQAIAVKEYDCSSPEDFIFDTTQRREYKKCCIDQNLSKFESKKTLKYSNSENRKKNCPLLEKFKARRCINPNLQERTKKIFLEFDNKFKASRVRSGDRSSVSISFSTNRLEEAPPKKPLFSSRSLRVKMPDLVTELTNPNKHVIITELPLIKCIKGPVYFKDYQDKKKQPSVVSSLFTKSLSYSSSKQIPRKKGVMLLSPRNVKSSNKLI